MITSSEITSLTPHAGRFRARLSYTLTDGRVVTRGPINVVDSVAADAKLSELGADVLKSVQTQDAIAAVSAGVQTAHGEASQTQVQVAWLRAGADEPDHFKAYHLMKDVGPLLLSLGYTDEQYAAAFDTSVEDVVANRTYWEFLDANKSTLLAYEAIA